MKKIVMTLILAAMLLSNGAHAQNTRGAAAKAGNTFSNDQFAWGIGLGMLAVVGTIAGITMSTSSSSSSSFSH